MKETNTNFSWFCCRFSFRPEIQWIINGECTLLAWKRSSRRGFRLCFSEKVVPSMESLAAAVIGREGGNRAAEAKTETVGHVRRENPSLFSWAHPRLVQLPPEQSISTEDFFSWKRDSEGIFIVRMGAIGGVRQRLTFVIKHAIEKAYLGESRQWKSPPKVKALVCRKEWSDERKVRHLSDLLKEQSAYDKNWDWLRESPSNAAKLAGGSDFTRASQKKLKRASK